jgi:proteasome accessory factor B
VDRLERLVNLVAALIDADRPLSREELRERVGGYSDDPDAFRRNFERDKDTLRQMGLPLVTEIFDPDRPEDQAGYRIPRERYELPDPGLSEEELTALRIAASAVRMDASWGDEASRSALRKLAAPGGTGPTGPAGPVTTGVAELAGGEAVVTVFGAIADRRRLAFRYRGEDRSVDPWRLSYRNGQWYLSGRDHAREGERLYRLDRVDGPVEATGEPDAFPPPVAGAVAPPPPWRLGVEPETEVRILVDGDQSPWAVASAGADTVAVRHRDGAVELVLPVTNRDALRSWLLGFLDHAEVLDPPEVRDEVRSWLVALATGAP